MTICGRAKIDLPAGITTQVEIEEWEAQRKRQMYNHNLLNSRIPSRYNYTDEAINLKVQGYAERIRRGQNLVITGVCGSGKTHLACQILRWLAHYGSVSFITFVDLFEDVKQGFKDGKNESQALSEFTACQFLVIDDFGKERITEWTLPLIFSLINRRYNKMRPIIYTTQYNAKELHSRLVTPADKHTAEAIISRMQEAFTLNCGTVDRRAQRWTA